MTMPDDKRRKGLYAKGELTQEEISTPAARPKDSTLLLKHELRCLPDPTKRLCRLQQKVSE